MSPRRAQVAEARSPIARVASIVVFPNGHRSAEAGLGGDNLLRTIDDSEEIGRLSTNHGVLGLAVSPNGMLLACATSNGPFNLWGATSGETGPVPPARAP